MNWLLLVVILLLAGFAFKGRQDGFIRTVFSIFSAIIALVIAVAAGPAVSKNLQNNDKLMSKVTEQVAKVLPIEETADMTKQIEAINKLKLPESLKKSLTENNNSEVYKALVVKDFKNYVSRYVSVVIVNAASFVLVFLLLRIALWVLSRVLDLVSRLPIINGLNRTAGLLVGLLHGLIIIWILCIVLTMFSSTETAKIFYSCINDSRILSSIYNNNLLMKAVTDIAKVLF